MCWPALLLLASTVQPCSALPFDHPCAQAKHLTRDQYAMNHPAGRIGKRLMLRVVDVMIRCAEGFLGAEGFGMPRV